MKAIKLKHIFIISTMIWISKQNVCCIQQTCWLFAMKNFQPFSVRFLNSPEFQLNSLLLFFFCLVPPNFTVFMSTLCTTAHRWCHGMVHFWQQELNQFRNFYSDARPNKKPHLGVSVFVVLLLNVLGIWALPVYRLRWLHQQQLHLPHTSVVVIKSKWTKVLWNTIWSCFCRSLLADKTCRHTQFARMKIFRYFSLYYFISAFSVLVRQWRLSVLFLLLLFLCFVFNFILQCPVMFKMLLLRELPTERELLVCKI